MGKIRILGFVGSLRKGSFNKELMNAAIELVPAELADIDVFDLEGIPPFNQDFENNMPERVKVFKKKIKEADALLIATPEYNYSFPGVLKNAIDWASRPYTNNSFEGKPVAIMSAAGGMIGGARAQYQLRQVFVYLDMHAINKPEVIVPFINEKIDSSGRLTDPHTRAKIKELIEALIKLANEKKSQ